MTLRFGKKEFEHLKSRDRRLGAVIARIGHIRWSVAAAALVAAIVSQAAERSMSSQ